MNNQQEERPQIQSQVSDSYSDNFRKFFNVLTSKLTALILTVISMILSLGSLFGLDKQLSDIPPLVLTLAFMIVVLSIVGILGVVLYNHQNKRRARILTDLKITENEFFSGVDSSILILLGTERTNE